MRRTIALMLLAAWPAAAHAAKPPSTEAVFRQFDLFGDWAVDCARPAAPDNPHVSDTVLSPGVVMERHDIGDANVVNRYSVLTAEPLSKTKLALLVLFQPGSPDEQRQRLVVVVRDGTRRTVFNQAIDGPVAVQDGVAVRFGLPTPLLKKCE
jgi:hypothetical protein